MSTLYIDRKNTRMTVSGNTLVFYENGERASTLRPEDFTMQGDACHMGKAARARYYPAFENALKTWQGEMRARCVALLRALGNACFNHPQTRNCAAAFLEEEALLPL